VDLGRCWGSWGSKVWSIEMGHLAAAGIMIEQGNLKPVLDAVAMYSI